MIKFKHNARDQFYNLAYDTLSVVADELKREIEKRRANEVDNDTIRRLDDYDKSFTEYMSKSNFYEQLQTNRMGLRNVWQ